MTPLMADQAFQGNPVLTPKRCCLYAVFMAWAKMSAAAASAVRITWA
jgi:hypothetical protein